MKSLNVTIYRFALGDCTNNGVSSRHNSMVAFDGDLEEIRQYAESKKIDVDKCLYLVRRELWGENHFYFTPLEFALNEPNGVVCMGGNYCCTSDSRWSEMVGDSNPRPIHDRFETWNQYEGLSR